MTEPNDSDSPFQEKSQPKPLLSCVEILREKFNQSLGLPVAEVVNESAIEQTLVDCQISYRKHLFCPIVTLWTWVSFDNLNWGDVILGDRIFCSYADISQRLKRGSILFFAKTVGENPIFAGARGWGNLIILWFGTNPNNVQRDFAKSGFHNCQIRCLSEKSESSLRTKALEPNKSP
jgi:hypothetical protein